MSAWVSPFQEPNHAYSEHEKSSNSNCWSVAILNWIAEVVSSTINLAVSVVPQGKNASILEEHRMSDKTTDHFVTS